MLTPDCEDPVALLRDMVRVRRLKHRYANLCDENYNADKLIELFTDDAVWTGPQDYGHHVGRDALYSFFKRLGGGSALFTIHMLGNEEITIEGDKAYGRWAVIAPCTFSVEGTATDFWGFLRYDDEFVRVNGEWKISKITATALAGGLHSAGWSASVTPPTD